MAIHEPIMVDEVIEFFDIDALSKKYIDATVGHGGHAIEIAKKGGVVLGIDADKEAIEIAKDRLEGKSKLIQGNFINIDRIAQKEGFEDIDGILFDLGVNLDQMTSQRRGFSFSHPDSLLDMRLSPQKQGPKASDLLSVLRKDQLKELFGAVLNELESRKVAEAVVARREEKPIITVGDFLEIANKIFRKKSKTHPATRAFLALRIAVNSELENLKKALPKAFGLLKKGGRLAVITFHSGEDLIVKKYFKKIEDKGLGKRLFKKPVVPKEDEIKRNPRSRSAKLRVVEKI